MKNEKMLHNAIDNICCIVLQSKKTKEVNTLINSKKMKGRMVEMGITQKDIAEKLGVAAPTVSQKINNVRPMDLVEAEKIADMLNISDFEFREYFFYNGVA